MLSAPLGHWATWSTSSWLDAFSGVIQGRSLGLNTCGRPRAQLPQWTHSLGCHRIVTSPLVYVRLSMGTTEFIARAA